nr:hypothetical protein [Tanacetum cinerariifolium]
MPANIEIQSNPFRGVDTIADVNVNALADQAHTMAPPIRTDDQILPHIRWVPIGKSNCYLDVEKSQSNPIYKIAVDILKHTNFFRAFTASSTIPSIYIQQFWDTRKHKFHPRPKSSLHLYNEEPVLGYLKFSTKGTKREVFGMPIPGSLITAGIQGASYYQEYLAKVSKHQRYLADETGSDPDSPALKPTKTAKKPKPTAPKADPRPPVSKPASSKQPEPKPTPAKTQGKKRNSLRSVDEFVAEDIPEKEPRVDDEEADVQWALEESLKSMYDVPQGPLPPVVIREPEFGKYQSLPEVSKKGKENISEEQEESDEDVPRTDAGIQGEGQAAPDPDAQDEGQAGSNPDKQAEGQARPDPGDAEAYQPLPSPVVYAGSDLEHIDLDVADVSTQPPPEQMDEGFTATAYPKLLKATAIETTTTTTTTIHPPPSQQQQSTTDSMIIKCIDELEHIMANLVQDNKRLEKRLDSHRARLYTLENLDIPYQVSKAADEVVTDAVDWAMQAPLHNRFRDLPEADMKEILHQRMWETSSYKTYEDHMQLYESLEKSMNRDHSKELAKDLDEACKKKKKSRDSPKTTPESPPHQLPPPPPPADPSRASGSPEASGSSQVPPPPTPPPSTNREGQSKGSAGPSSSKTAASVEYQAWTTTDTRLRPSISLTPADLQMDDDMAPDAQAQSSDDEDIGNVHIPKVNLRQDWWKPLKEERPAMLEPAWSIPSSDVPGLKKNWASALASTIHLLQKTRYSRRLMIWQCLWTGYVRDKESPSSNLKTWKALHVKLSKSFILIYGSKGSRPALSILKMKAAYYPNAGLEQMVPDQMWIEKECKHTSEGDRRAVRTHMRVLSVVRIEVFSMYGHLVIRQRVEDFQLGIQSYQTQLNLTKPRWDATGIEYRHDYTVIDSLRAITFRDRYGVQMIKHFNEIYKFSDGTLQQIDEALDYRVKEFKINRMNPGLNTRF